MTDPVVVVGAGQAGYQAAASLRDAKYDGRIVLISDEEEIPYQRPPLSKAFLAGKAARNSLAFRPSTFYEKHEIDLLCGERVTSIDRHAATIDLASGAVMSYAHLVLATGSRPRPLRVPGGQLDGVLTLRTVADAEEIVQRLTAARRLVVVGGGFIGLEVAAVAREMGAEVTVVEILPRLMARAVSTAVSSFYAEEHSAWGTRILLATGLARVLDNGTGKVAGVETDDGTSLEADLVLVGIGVAPNSELAESCGLPCRNGIVVDSHLRSEDDRISAVGDCVRFPSPFADDPVRLESVQNAGEQARSLAARLTGHTKPYQNVPWFWSDQRDLKMQLAGLTGSADQTIVRGNPAERSFSVFCFRRGILLGVESVNRPSDHAAARRLLGMETERRELRPVDVAKEDFDLKSYVRAISSAPVPIRAG